MSCDCIINVSRNPSLTPLLRVTLDLLVPLVPPGKMDPKV